MRKFKLIALSLPQNLADRNQLKQGFPFTAAQLYLLPVKAEKISGRKITKKEHFSFYWGLKKAKIMIGVSIFSHLHKTHFIRFSLGKTQILAFQGRNGYVRMPNSEPDNTYCLSIKNSEEVIGHGVISFIDKHSFFRYSIHNDFQKQCYGKEALALITAICACGLLAGRSSETINFRYYPEELTGDISINRFLLMKNLLLRAGFKPTVFPEHNNQMVFQYQNKD
ncbi:MAG: hypothetical protein PHV30_11415 [Candidatus Margulisbacteria bacterium]|nr:hypothetical protein [Candidatus Margulisiibacteriota bacterium]